LILEEAARCGGNGARKRQQEREEDVEGNKILAESCRYGHSRPGKTVL
jgi:hypothetical protein